MDMLVGQTIRSAELFCTIAIPLLAQSTLAVGLVWGIDSAFKKRLSPVLRYRMWAAALICSVVPLWPVLGIPLASGSAGHPVIALILAAVWLLGMIVFAIVVVARTLRLGRAAAAAEQPTAFAQGALRYCQSCVKTGYHVRLRVSEDVCSPVVWGVLRPVILLPHDLAPRFGSRHLRAVLLHQLARIKRGDIWINLVQTVLQIVWFFSPPVWLANSKLSELRGRLADTVVLQATDSKLRWYRQSLADIARLALNSPLVLALTGVGA